jgi:TonB family protein
MKIYTLMTLMWSLQLALPPFALEYAPAPGSPPNIVGFSAVVLTADVSREGIPANIQVVSGGPPFVTPTVRSVTGWRFRNDTRIDRPVSVTFLFRPASVYSFSPTPIQFPPLENRREDLPPMPLVVIDAEFPPSSTAEGPVVLQIDVSSAGSPTGIREIGNAGALGQMAMSAVRQWRFQPATRAGRNVEGTAIAVISFLRPVIAE